MEDKTNQDPVDQSENTSGNSDQEKDVVAYDSFQKVLNEKKQTQAKFNELQEKLKSLEEEKLQAEGNKDQLIENYKKRLAETEQKLSKTHNNFAWNVTTRELKSIARELGADTPSKQDAVIRLLPDDVLGKFEVDEDYNMDREQAKSVLEDWKKSNLDVINWNSSSKKFANGNPTNKPPKDETKDLSKLSKEQLEELYKKVYKR